jgi:DNA-binding beta-propeller fold protein YncE
MYDCKRQARSMKALLALSAVLGAILATALAAGGSAATGHGEIWAVAEDTGTIYVLNGQGAHVESVTHPLIQKPHLMTFSPSGRYAYLADVGNGRLNVIRRNDRELVASVPFPVGLDTHQGQASPDGETILVARRVGSRTLYRVVANEHAETWTLAAESLTFPGGRTPICTVFRPDGIRAYVFLAPSGIAVVDVPTMTLATDAGVGGIIPTTGLIGCGFAESRDRRFAYAVSGAGSGHFYRLDLLGAELTELNPAVGATDLHNLALSANEEVAYASSRGSDELLTIDLTTGLVLDRLPVDATAGPDLPDGVAVKGNTVYVALKAAGKVAIVKANQQEVEYVDVTAPSLNALPHVSVRG